MTSNQLAYQTLQMNKERTAAENALTFQKTRAQKAQSDMDVAESKRQMYFKYGDRSGDYNPDINEWIDYYAERALEKLGNLFSFKLSV